MYIIYVDCTYIYVIVYLFIHVHYNTVLILSYTIVATHAASLVIRDKYTGRTRNPDIKRLNVDM